MTLDEAVKVLNEVRHRGRDDWYVSRDYDLRTDGIIVVSYRPEPIKLVAEYALEFAQSLKAMSGPDAAHRLRSAVEELLEVCDELENEACAYSHYFGLQPKYRAKWDAAKTILAEVAEAEL